MTVAASPLDIPAEVKRERRTLSLAQKFAIAFLGLVAAVLIINGAIDMGITYRDARAQAVRVQQEKANAAAERVVQFVTEIEQQLGWTTRSEWARVSVEQRRYDFIRLLRQAAAITELVHVDGVGREQLKLSRLEPDQVGSSADYSADPRFVATIRDKIYYGPVTFRRGSEPYMTIGMAHAGRNAGATIADVNLKLAWDVVTSIRVGNTGYAFITDPAGRLIAHPDMSLVLRNTDLSALPQVAAARSVGAGAPTVADGLGSDGRSVLSANAKVPKVGWNVFVELPAAEALGPVWSALYQTLALLALGVALAGAAGTLLARRMVVPITELQAGAQKLGEGDLASRIPVRSGDEIGALAQRFNVMAGRIQESQETLEGKVEARTAELNESLRQQTATSDILRVISGSPTDVTPVFNAIVEAALRLLACDMAAVFTSDGRTYSPVAGATPDNPRAPMGPSNVPVDPDQTFPSRAIVTKSIVHVPNWSAIELPAHEQQIHKTLGVNSSLHLPLMRGDECLGVLGFGCNRAREFSSTEIALAESFRDQAMIAVENVRLFNETREALDRQNATAEVLQVISGSVADIQPVFDVIAERSARLTQADYGWVFLLRDGMIHVASSFGIDTNGLAAARKVFPIPLSRTSVTGRAISDGVVVRIADVLAAPDIAEDLKQLAKRAGNRSNLSVPMRHDGKVIGAITVQRAVVGDFALKEVEVLQTFADQAVIAIQNSRLFKETQDRTREVTEALEYQTATSDVLGVISKSPSQVEPVFDAIVATARRLCGAEYALINKRSPDGMYRLAAHSGATPEFVEWLQTKPVRAGDGSAVGIVAFDKRTLHLPDALADPRFTDLKRQRQSKARTMLAVPLMSAGEVTGVVFLAHTVVRPFTDRQIELVTTFADQAVIAIENARLFEQVQTRTKELQGSLEDLRTAQDRLVQTEKLASLGQLTAGVAHEIKNPLNFVNNFADLSVELVAEIEDAITSAGAALDPKIKAEVGEIAGMLKSNLAKVVHHGRRADSIVKNMLAHSRESSGERRQVDLNATVDEALSLAYHGARAEKPGFNITLERDLDPTVGQIELYPQEFTRVLLNLIGNGFHAANKKRLDGAPPSFEPVLKVTTKAFLDKIEIKVRDNGTGIPDAVRARIFEPFFTTKPTGEGTGLGLSLSHDIVVKQHGGSLTVTTEPGNFTEFVVMLPLSFAAAEQLK